MYPVSRCVASVKGQGERQGKSAKLRLAGNIVIVSGIYQGNKRAGAGKRHLQAALLTLFFRMLTEAVFIGRKL